MKYRCTRTVEHDQVRYHPGDKIEISGKARDDLLEVGAIEPFNKPFAAKPVSVVLKPKEESANV